MRVYGIFGKIHHQGATIHFLILSRIVCYRCFMHDAITNGWSVPLYRSTSSAPCTLSPASTAFREAVLHRLALLLALPKPLFHLVKKFDIL
jgi:hypothetical protein